MSLDASPKCARASPSFLLCTDALPAPEHFLLPATTVPAANRSNTVDHVGARYMAGTVTAPAAGAYGAPANSNGTDLVITKRDATGAIPYGNTAVDIVFPYGKNV